MSARQKVRTHNLFPFGNPYLWGAQPGWFGQNFPFGGFLPGMSGQKLLGGSKFAALPAASPQAAQSAQPTQPPGSLWQQIGGLDGIITNMGKVQKILQMTQSFSPYLKMFTQASPPGGYPSGPGKRPPSSGKPAARRKRTPSRKKRK